MRIHAIQTGTVAIKQRQRRGEGHGAMRMLNTLRDKSWTEPLPIYAWVIEHPEGAIVVDTGETARTAEPGYFPRWHPYYKMGVREWVGAEQEIGPQLRMLGIAPSDVRWLVLTHLHTDHAGGLHHFPRTETLVSRTELAQAAGWPGLIRGYLPNRWPETFVPRAIEFTDQAFGPFPRSLSLTQSGDVVLVPTPGHTPGHLSVIVREPGHAVFLAGDTSYTERIMLDQAPDGVAPDEHSAIQTLARILALARHVPTVYLPSHDPESAQRLAARKTVPIEVAIAAGTALDE
jgi:glyoxylase-like metal-dependent hydrolase (beta-lactamase superfamily II)